MIPEWTTPRQDLKNWRPGLQGDPETEDIMALYEALIPRLGPAPTIVEVGVAWGRSLLFAAKTVLDLGLDRAKLYAIDPWRGPGDPKRGSSNMDFAAALKSLLVQAEARELNILLLQRAPSPGAAKAFGLDDLDLVLLDGCHEHGAVVADMRAWLPLIRGGGFLAGHDYTDQFPGVVRAVGELLGGRHVIRGTCWVVEIGSEARGVVI